MLTGLLAQVETLLKTQDGDVKGGQASSVEMVETVSRSEVYHDTADLDLGSVDLFPHVPEPRTTWDDVGGEFQNRRPPIARSAPIARPLPSTAPDRCSFTPPKPRRNDEVITLGLEEPMPNQDVIHELYVWEAQQATTRLTASQEPTVF